jgi:DNA polymerase-3 subunit delta
MQLRAENLEAHLAKSLAPVYAIHGDEPLLALEAADAVRAAARGRGFAEREVFEADRFFKWDAFAHAAASGTLFGGRRILELRIPGGKPGTQGAEAIARYCGDPAPDALLLVSLPRLDRAAQGSAWFGGLAAAGVVVEVWPMERARLPEWIAARLARNGQRAAREVLEFLAERVEGNLLAAHQEVLKLALLAPPGELAFETVETAVANVARYGAFDAGAALLGGELARYARVLEALRSEGEAPTYVLWAIAEDLRAAARVQAGVAAGRPIEALLRENRLWGPRQASVKAAARRLPEAAVRAALARLSAIDRAAKGVAAGDPWDGLLALGLELFDGAKGARKIA